MSLSVIKGQVVSFTETGVIHFEKGALAVGDDGRIAWAGEAKSLPDTHVNAPKQDHGAKLVLPGFIDPHSHSDYSLLTDGNAESKIRQGVTTEVIGEIASRVNGAVSVAAVDPLKVRSFYSSTGPWVELSAPGGSNRGFSENGFIWQQTFNFDFTDTFLLNPASYRAPRFANRGAR